MHHVVGLSCARWWAAQHCCCIAICEASCGASQRVGRSHCCGIASQLRYRSQLHPCLPLQVKMWGECGGTLSAYRRNAADPGACCPINGVCNYVSTAHWQCQPKGWRAPASLQASYAPECSTDHLVSSGPRCLQTVTAAARRWADATAGAAAAAGQGLC